MIRRDEEVRDLEGKKREHRIQVWIEGRVVQRYDNEARKTKVVRHDNGNECIDQLHNDLSSPSASISKVEHSQFPLPMSISQLNIYIQLSISLVVENTGVVGAGCCIQVLQL